MDKFFDFFDRFEIAPNYIDWWWFPRGFRHFGVWWKDGQRATESGFFWLGIRCSFYHNIMSHREFVSRNNK